MEEHVSHVVRDGLLQTAAVLVLLPGLLATGNAQTPAASLDDFFDSSSLQEIRVRMDAADWQTLHDQYLDNTYYPCTFEWHGMEVKGAGIRSRGSGSRSPIKPGLGIDFSKFASGQRFLGMKSVVLRNLSQDASGLHEFLTEKLFAALGLPYSREAYARLYVNGNYSGLYVLVEPLDERFLRTRFGEDGGELYEVKQAGFAYQFQYLGADPALYIPDLFELKTKPTKPDPEGLVEMIRVLNEVPDAEFRAAMGRYLDLDSVAVHAAAEQFMGDWDGFLGETGITNFYLYRRAAGAPGVLLVWDKDGTMEDPGRSIWRNTDKNILVKRVLAVPELRDRYLTTLHMASEVAGGAGGWLAREAETAYALIRQAMYDDPNRVCLVGDDLGPCPIANFESSMDWVREFTRVRAERVNTELGAAGYVHKQGPVVQASALRNAASGGPVVSPGELAWLRVNVASSRQDEARAVPLPSSLQGIRVLVEGKAASLIRVDAQGILLQIPPEAECGPEAIGVEVDGAMSEIGTAEVRPALGGVFSLTHGDGSMVDGTRPAIPGEWVVAWVTGLGQGTETVEAGVPNPTDHLVPLATSVTALVGGEKAQVYWAGKAPGWIGLEQVILRIPDGLAAGSAKLVLLQNDEPGWGYLLAVGRASN